MEYYTKSEGLGFLIRKSRIDFRIEFRGVSILCEFNSLIWLVSHDHHQTVRYGEAAGVSTADSTFSNSNGRDRSPKWSKVTTRWSYRDSDTLASDDSNNAVDQVNHVGGVTSWILYSYRQENSAFNRQSTMAWSHMSNVT